MRFAIDTNTYEAFMKNEKNAVQLFRTADEIWVPIPVIGELRYGFVNGTLGKQNEALLLKFLDSPRVDVLECNEQTTHFYAQLRLQLKRQGTPIPTNDLWIASLALQHGLSLFTFDKDFQCIPQLPRI